MNIYIVDTNIVYSTFLNTQSNIGDLLLNSDDVFEFYAPSYLREEIQNHKDNIIQYAKIDAVEFEELKHLIFQQLTFLSDQIIPFPIWYESAQLVREVDPDDIAFVAYSKYYNKDIWTGDKQFIEGMKAKGFNHFVTTPQLITIREELRA